MKNEIENEERLQRFMLGDLAEPERVDLEDSFLAHDDRYQELLLAEDDLIDAYVRDELSADDRALFEQRLSASETRRDRVEFARTLSKAVSGRAVAADVSDPELSWWGALTRSLVIRRPVAGFAYAAALLVIVLGALWFLRDKLLTRPTPEQARIIQPTSVTPGESSTSAPTAVQQQATRDQPGSNPAPARDTPKRTAPVIATFTLLPGSVRGQNGAGALALPAGATEVWLRLALEGEPYKNYRATLSTPEGRRIWSRELSHGSSTREAQLTLSIPADLLKSGDYVLDLSGASASGAWESVADYSFRIVKR